MIVPITRIFNSVFRSGEWPTRWKEETTVIIPKVPNPESLSDCRNISCTAFLSKVLESVLLEDLRKEIPLNPIQYGGIKASSLDHLLVDLYDTVLRPMEDGDPSVILGIDYEKAFNRMNHRECLVQLRKLGASDPSLALVRSFLTGRTMRVKTPGGLSRPKLLRGGSPQGSILGCLLYCITTQQIGPDLTDPRRRPLPYGDDPPQENPPVEHLPLPSPPAAARAGNDTPPGFRVGTWAATGLDLSDSSDDSFHTAEENPPPSLGELSDEEDTREVYCVMLKYVDDTTTVERIDRWSGIRHITRARTLEEFPAPITQSLMEAIITKAAEIGMKVNCKKTQFLILSPDNGCNTTASIAIDGNRLTSAGKLKLLGYVIGNAPGAHAQVEFIRDKFRRKFWSLIHLRRSGFKGGRLFRVYCALVRPVIETNSVVYHAMLTGTQAAELEKMQKKVLRLCFGRLTCYADRLRELGLESLETRRIKAARKFALKTYHSNPRFASRWFIPREEVRTELRKRRPIREMKARTERLRKSPLAYLQRTLNDALTAN